MTEKETNSPLSFDDLPEAGDVEGAHDTPEWEDEAPADEEAEEPPEYEWPLGPIKVGDRFIWMPDNEKMRVAIVVTELDNANPDEEPRIQSANAAGKKTWKSEPIFRANTVRDAEPSPLVESVADGPSAEEEVA